MGNCYLILFLIHLDYISYLVIHIYVLMYLSISESYVKLPYFNKEIREKDL